MGSRIFVMLALALLPIRTPAQDQKVSTTNQLLFSYFKGNGEDGLHLAYSQDGLKWRALNNDRPFISPQVGQDNWRRRKG